jgi:hypothetical protein
MCRFGTAELACSGVAALANQCCVQADPLFGYDASCRTWPGQSRPASGLAADSVTVGKATRYSIGDKRHGSTRVFGGYRRDYMRGAFR